LVTHVLPERQLDAWLENFLIVQCFYVMLWWDHGNDYWCC